MAVAPSFSNHISLMFRSMDIQHMRFKFDLTDYDDVRNSSEDILKSLKGLEGRRVMPPIENGGPWPEEWIALFERWITEGYPL